MSCKTIQETCNNDDAKDTHLDALLSLDIDFAHIWITPSLIILLTITLPTPTSAGH